MAFRRYANAKVTHPSVTQDQWRGLQGNRAVRVASTNNLVAQASEILGTQFDPSKYLLTHATIVCSVDTDPTPNVKLGKVREGSTTIDRRYANYLIKPDSSKFVNNNGDAWTRPVLMKSFRTFIGAQNYLEHVQVEELSKGRIIDAVARDVGESLYIDILVATDRKHTELVADILSGKMSGMSMGCNTVNTQCTKCGNVAEDETQLCSCVRYQKLQKFIGADGKQRVIAELCGHESLDPTAGVTFIEASWVANPAFTGAVLRNVIDVANMTDSAVKKAREVLSSPPPQWVGVGRPVAASLRTGEEFDFSGMGEEDGGGGEEGAEPAPEGDAEKKPESLLKETEDKLYREMLDRVENRVRKEISDKEESSKPVTAPNDTLIKNARVADVYKAAVSDIVRTASSPSSVVVRIAALDSASGVLASEDVYRTMIRVGSIDRYGSQEGFLSACASVLGRVPAQSEADALVRIGRILNKAGQPATRTPARSKR